MTFVLVDAADETQMWRTVAHCVNTDKGFRPLLVIMEVNAMADIYCM